MTSFRSSANRCRCSIQYDLTDLIFVCAVTDTTSVCLFFVEQLKTPASEKVIFCKVQNSDIRWFVNQIVVVWSSAKCKSELRCWNLESVIFLIQQNDYNFDIVFSSVRAFSIHRQQSVNQNIIEEFTNRLVFSMIGVKAKWFLLWCCFQFSKCKSKCDAASQTFDYSRRHWIVCHLTITKVSFVLIKRLQ